jgi:hypothetical protein
MCFRDLAGKLEGRDRLEDLDVDETVASQWILKNQDERL